MLNPFIIDQIRRREQEKGFEQVQLELPKPEFYPAAEEKEEEEPERGVVIIDLWG